MNTPKVPWPKLSRGLIAILRGVRPEQVIAIADVLVAAGFPAIEVPLNSPDPLRSIELLARHAGTSIVIGAGTVLTAADVDRVADAGGRLIVSPNCDRSVIERTVARGLVSMPGVLTPTDAFTALAAGASALKFFPASVIGAAGIKAIGAVLPKGTVVGAVGGVSDGDFDSYARAGVSVFGLGSSLYRAGNSAAEVASRAAAAVVASDRVVGLPKG